MLALPLPANSTKEPPSRPAHLVCNTFRSPQLCSLLFAPPQPTDTPTQTPLITSLGRALHRPSKITQATSLSYFKFDAILVYCFRPLIAINLIDFTTIHNPYDGGDNNRRYTNKVEFAAILYPIVTKLILALVGLGNR